MPTRLALRVLALLLVLVVLPLAFVRATHSPKTAQVVAAAEQLGMKCTSSAAQVDCDGPSGSAVRFPHTTIRPASGALVDVFTRIDAHSNGAHELFFDDRVWMTEVHSVGCANKNGVSQFLADLDATFRNADTGGTLGRTVGECQLTGTFEFPSRVSCPRVPCYSVTSTILPGAFPTPTPPPPTPPPVVTPTPTPTPTPSPTPTASPTPTPTATPSPTPTPSGSQTASPTRTPRPSATPEQTVAGITFAPEPSLPLPDIAADPTGWAASVHDPADVSTDPAAMGVSALLAVLLLLFMGFVGELFNNTMKAHYDEISGWWQKGLLGRLAAAWSSIWKAGP